MAKGLITDTYLSNIADAIRTKNGTETQYKPSEMASAINSISTKARPDYVSFYRYKGTSLDTSWLDTSNVTAMTSMFHDCGSLTTLDLSAFDTSSVTAMTSMFYGCSSLTTLDLSNWDTSSVTNMGTMFRRCGSLTTLDVSNFNTSNVTSMRHMFYGCSSLTTLDLSNWDTSSVTDMQSMFANCKKLTELDISNMDLTKANINNMFSNCGSDNETPTIVYVKDEASQQKVLSATGTPASWSTANVIIKEATT